MLINIDYKLNRHAYFKLSYNLVVYTFKNKKIINKLIEDELHKIVLENFKKHKCTLNKIGFKDGNTLVLNFDAPPHIQLSKLVNNFKTVSSRLIRKKFKKYLENNEMETHLWELKYYISTYDRVI